MNDKPEKPVCATCGGDDVKADAYAAWDSDAQKWDVVDTYDKGAICEDCDGPCSLEWIEVLS